MLYFIVNHSSRSGKAGIIWTQIKEALTEQNLDYRAYRTQGEGDATELAKKISSLDEEDISLVVLGGDGTMNEVINGITDFDKVKLGMIPVGSGNDFGRGLHLSSTPIENLSSILRNAQSGRTTCVDLGEVRWEKGEKSRLYGISSGIGMDALVVKKSLHSPLKKVLNKLHLGKLTYLLITVQTLFSMETTTARLTWTQASFASSELGANSDHNFPEEGSVILKKLIFTASMNLRFEGGGVPMAPSATGDDGELTLCSAFGIPKWRTFLCLPILVAAKHSCLKGFHLQPCTEAHLSLDVPMALHADGEYLGDVTEAFYRCLPRKLRLLNDTKVLRSR